MSTFWYFILFIIIAIILILILPANILHWIINTLSQIFTTIGKDVLKKLSQASK